MIGTLTLSSAALLLVTTAALAAPPVEDIGKRHPNLAAAQRLSHQAWERITAAQQANEWDMDGHAAKAKDHGRARFVSGRRRRPAQPRTSWCTPSTRRATSPAVV